MMQQHFFRVAGLPFALTMPHALDSDLLLPSFRTFRCMERPAEEPIFSLTVTGQPRPETAECTEILDEAVNDMGHIRLMRCQDDYRIDLGCGHSVHTLTADHSFSRATAYMPAAVSAPILSSMLRILFSQSALLHGAVSIHASSICLDGCGYLFLGKSGTGKSTHAVQWLQAFHGSTLLNDDNPILRTTPDHTIMVCGSPWSGKTPCYRNVSCPVAGIVRLQQDSANRYLPLEGPEAFAAVLPSCSGIRQDSALQEALNTSLVRIVASTPVGRLQCRPDTEAARICLHALQWQTAHNSATHTSAL